MSDGIDQLLTDIPGLVRTWQRRLDNGLDPLRVGERARLSILIRNLEVSLDLSRHVAQQTAQVDARMGRLWSAADDAYRGLERAARAAQVDWFTALGWDTVTDPQLIREATLRGTQNITKDWSRLRPRAQSRISAAIRDLTLTGDNPQQASRQLARRLQGTVKDARRRAETILRTEAADTQARATQQLYDQNRDVLKGWEWLANGKNPCRICIALDGMLFPVGAEPNRHHNCLIGDTLITGAGGITGASDRRWEGETITLRTSQGHSLTGTPNHPILTPTGWAGLGDLVEGDRIVTQPGSIERVRVGDEDEQAQPASIREVVESFLGARGVSATEMPTTGPDFHGDGAGSEVAVVGAYRALQDSGAAEAAGHVSLKVRGVAEGLLPVSGGDGEGLGRAGGAPDSIMGSSGEGTPLAWGEPAHTQGRGDAKTSWSHVGGGEDPGDNWPANTVRLGDPDKRLTPIYVPRRDLIGFRVDTVESVTRAEFAGHVYNLETTGGWYAANNIVTHNCTCSQVPILDDDPKYRRVQPGEWPPDRNLPTQTRRDRERIGMRKNGEWRDSWALSTTRRTYPQPTYTTR